MLQYITEASNFIETGGFKDSYDPAEKYKK